MALTNTATGAIKSESGFLIQSGSSVTGNILLTGQTSCAGVGSVQGRINGSNLAMTVLQVGATLNLTGASANNGSAMSGDYSILASPCGNSQVGTWTAVQVPTLTGSFQATFTSTTTPGTVANFTGTVSQSPNSGGTSANLTGNMTSTDSTCLTTATIAGQITGTTVVLNLLSSEGTATGQYVGTATADAATITGSYHFSPQSQPAGGCDDLGTGTIAVKLTPSGK